MVHFGFDSPYLSVPHLVKCDDIEKSGGNCNVLGGDTR
jgi:hypothetical protein